MEKEDVKFVEGILYEIYMNIGINKPENHEDIIQFICEDVDASADADFTSGDIEIAFRRLIETYKY